MFFPLILGCFQVGLEFRILASVTLHSEFNLTSAKSLYFQLLMVLCQATLQPELSSFLPLLKIIYITYSDIYFLFVVFRDVLLWAGICKCVRYHMLLRFQW